MDDYVNILVILWQWHSGSLLGYNMTCLNDGITLGMLGTLKSIRLFTRCALLYVYI